MERVVRFYHTAAGRCPIEEFLDGLDDRVYRFLGFWDSGALIILTHGFQKKTPKTPLQEINKALNLKADWERRK